MRNVAGIGQAEAKKSSDMLNLPIPEFESITVKTQPSDSQKDAVRELAARADAVKDRIVSPSEDNFLKITSDGRKLALDQRLYDETLPDDPGSKVNACVSNVLEIWRETAPFCGAQLIFSDLSTPRGDGKFNIIIQNTTYTERKLAGEAIYEVKKALQERQNTDAVPLGSVRGLPMTLIYNAANGDATISIKGKMTYSVKLGYDPVGNTTRITNALDEIPELLQQQENTLAALQSQLISAEEEVKRLFEKEAELAEKSARLAQLNIELDHEGGGYDNMRAYMLKMALVCKTYEFFLDKIASLGYEIRQRGDSLSMRPPEQERFARVNKFGAEHSPEALRGRVGKSVTTEKFQPANQDKIGKPIDVGAKIQQGKGAGYLRWSRIFNLKNMAKTVTFLTEHGISDYDQLVEATENSRAAFHEAKQKLNENKAQRDEIAEMRGHVKAFAKTKAVYDKYRKSHNGAEFFAAHEPEIRAHETAKAYFNAHKIFGELPGVAALSAKYNALMARKTADYEDYARLKTESQ
jgi:hypothetical protein